MAHRDIDGRAALDRAGVAARIGVAYSTVNHWYAHRDHFGFPDGVTSQGVQWFFVDEIDVFHVAHQARKKAELTKVDRSGDPNELVTSGGAAKILGYASYRNLPDELLERADDMALTPTGRIRRRWYRRTVWALADTRTGRQSTGRTPGTTGPRLPHPYAHDPRLDLAAALLAHAHNTGRDRRGLGVELAHRLGVSERVAQRLLAAAETHR